MKVTIIISLCSFETDRILEGKENNQKKHISIFNNDKFREKREKRKMWRLGVQTVIRVSLTKKSDSFLSRD